MSKLYKKRLDKQYDVVSKQLKEIEGMKGSRDYAYREGLVDGILYAKLLYEKDKQVLDALNE